MNGRQPMCMLLRPGLPLLAVLALLGPATALAAGPAPDVPPPVGGLHPDPVPTQDVQAPTPRRAPVQRIQRIVAAPTPPVTAQAPAAKPPPRAKPATRSVKRHASPLPRVVDVTPQFVDVPVGLGEVARSLRDESSALLAALALLAAAAAAASGVALTFVWGREAAL
jgi:hypothetical protein